jgi:nitroreductase
MNDDASRPLEHAGLVEAARGRASVRRFLPDPVPHEHVTAMVDLAVHAANAGNAQIWHFIAVEDPLTQVAIREAVDDALDVMAAWPELSGNAKEIKALRAYSTFFVEAPIVMTVFGYPYLSRADEMLLARGLGAE